MATLTLLVETAGLHYLLANLVGTGVAAAWNFTLSVLWTWRRSG